MLGRSRLAWGRGGVAFGAAALVLAGLTGCGDPGQPGGAVSAAPGGPSASTASASASAQPLPPWIGIDRSRAEVEKVINPKGAEPYRGPTGTLRGRITIVGDPPPKLRQAFPEDCAEAAATYDAAFRVGQSPEAGKGAALADALVAVTGYEGFVPPEDAAVPVRIRGCAFDKRTYAATFGQRFEVVNLDPKNSYMPYLMGAPMRAYMVAMPRGNPVKLYPLEPSASRYLLRDQMKRPFLVSEVYVLKYATHAVTGLDGLYEIKRIPVGKVRVDAFLPAIDKSEGKEIELKEGVNELDLELRFDAKTDRVVELPLDTPSPAAPAGSASGSAAAAPSAAAPAPSASAAP